MRPFGQPRLLKRSFDRVFPKKYILKGAFADSFGRGRKAFFMLFQPFRKPLFPSFRVFFPRRKKCGRKTSERTLLKERLYEGSFSFEQARIRGRKTSIFRLFLAAFVRKRRSGCFSFRIFSINLPLFVQKL